MTMVEIDAILARAKNVLACSKSTTYPSMAASNNVRKLISDLVDIIERLRPVDETITGQLTDEQRANLEE